MPQVQVLYRPPAISGTYGHHSASPFYFPRTIPRTQTKKSLRLWEKGCEQYSSPTAAEQPQYSPSIPTCLPFPNFRHPPDTRECIHSDKVEAFTFLGSTLLTMPLTLPCASSLPLPERNRLKPYLKTLSQPSQLSHHHMYQRFSVGQSVFFKMSQLSHCPKFKVAQSYNSPFGYASGNLP